MPTENDNPDLILLSKSEVARRTGLASGTVAAEIEDGRLRVTRVRRRTLIHRDDLEAWLDLCRQEDDSDAA